MFEYTAIMHFCLRSECSINPIPGSPEVESVKHSEQDTDIIILRNCRGKWEEGFESGKVGGKKVRKENQLKGMCVRAYMLNTDAQGEKRKG